MSTAVVMFRDKNAPLVNVAGVKQVYGGTLPAQLWAAFMKAALAHTKVVNFPPPGNVGVPASPPPSSAPPVSSAPPASVPASAVPTVQPNPTASHSPSPSRSKKPSPSPSPTAGAGGATAAGP
jgi:membrane peptidoglycan carboxypeptidase